MSLLLAELIVFKQRSLLLNTAICRYGGLLLNNEAFPLK